MLLRPEREYDTPPKYCTIKIDENLYPSEMQEHRLISDRFDVNMEIVTDCRIIRKYIFEKPIAVFIPGPFKVECDDGHCSICYMADNRLSIIEIEGTKMDFSKAMNPPDDVFDGRADVKAGWVVCPFCQKKQFKVNPDTKIEKMPYKCKNSKCRKEIIVNVE